MGDLLEKEKEQAVRISSMNENLKIVSVREILKENLTIPGYQRPYRWSTESAATLVSDSHGAFVAKAAEYRIGSVVLHKVKDKDGVVNYNVVDGQQRLTTLSIMLFALEELVKDKGDENLSKL